MISSMTYHQVHCIQEDCHPKQPQNVNPAATPKTAIDQSLMVDTHREDSIYHSLSYTSCGPLAGTQNSLMGSPWRVDPTTHSAISGCSTSELQHPLIICISLKQHSTHLYHVVRTFAPGATGRQIDPSWWTHWAISHSIQCSTSVVTKVMVCAVLSVGWCI